MWPNCVQVAQLRGLSDHCPLILSVDEENWGPRPSRFLKCWSDARVINSSCGLRGALSKWKGGVGMC